MMDYAVARNNMVESQIRTNRVTDPRIIGAMSELPRETFLPKNLRGIAYVDEDVPLGAGRYLMEPLVLARLLQHAEIRDSDVVLNIGAGVGYDAAVISRLATTVIGLESDPALVSQANKTLGTLGIDNVVLVEGTLEAGYPRQAPYDVIVLGGSVETVPDDIVRQLAPGGRLVGVAMAPGEPGRAVLFLRVGDIVNRRTLFDATTGRLPGFSQEPSFVF
jgi:protein-L-isoaspartate(D-aspartate) O-methyltransferase